MISPLCDPDNITVWLYVLLATGAAVLIGFGYGRWARARVPGGGLINAQRWPVVLLSLALPFAATLLAALVYDAAFPSVDHCASTDRHVLPFWMTLATLPGIWTGALAGCWRAAP
jgi:ABC-type amino acid transport system permease subunit